MPTRNGPGIARDGGAGPHRIEGDMPHENEHFDSEDWHASPRGQRLHLASSVTRTGVRADVPFAICHADITGFVRRTTRVPKFLRAKDQCGNCYRIYKARLDS